MYTMVVRRTRGRSKGRSRTRRSKAISKRYRGRRSARRTRRRTRSGRRRPRRTRRKSRRMKGGMHSIPEEFDVEPEPMPPQEQEPLYAYLAVGYRIYNKGRFRGSYEKDEVNGLLAIQRIPGSSNHMFHLAPLHNIDGEFQGDRRDR